MMLLKTRPSVVLFGDSITEQGFGSIDGSDIVGWASLISSAYSRRADVFNRGFSGYNSRHGLDVLPKLLPEITTSSSLSKDDGHNTLFWTIFFGANDATLSGERQHVPLEEYGENIKKMVDIIREKHGIEYNSESTPSSENSTSCSSSESLPIILITPPPVNATMWETYCLTTFGERRGRRSLKSVQKYAMKLKQIGKKYHCPVLDLFEIFEKSENKDFFCDGLHLSSLGNRLVFEGLMELIKREFPNKAPREEDRGTGLPLDEKLWSELC